MFSSCNYSLTVNKSVHLGFDSIIEPVPLSVIVLMHLLSAAVQLGY